MQAHQTPMEVPDQRAAATPELDAVVHSAADVAASLLVNSTLQEHGDNQPPTNSIEPKTWPKPGELERPEWLEKLPPLYGDTVARQYLEMRDTLIEEETTLTTSWLTESADMPPLERFRERIEALQAAYDRMTKFGWKPEVVFIPSMPIVDWNVLYAYANDHVEIHDREAVETTGEWYKSGGNSWDVAVIAGTDDLPITRLNPNYEGLRIKNAVHKLRQLPGVSGPDARSVVRQASPPVDAYLAREWSNSMKRAGNPKIGKSDSIGRPVMLGGIQCDVYFYRDPAYKSTHVQISSAHVGRIRDVALYGDLQVRPCVLGSELVAAANTKQK